MAETKPRSVKLIKRGPYSYALPLTKTDLARLGLLDDPHQEPDEQTLHLSFEQSQYHHRLVITNAAEDHANKPYNNDLSHMFEDFFKRHPEITDRKAYMQSIYNDLRHDQGYDSTNTTHTKEKD